jgi:enterochelin esterase-like enzyme
MEPDSVTLVVLLFLLAAGAVAAAVRFRPIAVKAVGGLLALALAATGGMAIVNDYYGYYQTWSQLSADLSGSYAAFSTASTTVRGSDPVRAGELRTVTLAGKLSHITRKGLVYLPPQYFEKRYAHTRFPTLELLHGSPGKPSHWVVQLRVAQVMDRLLAEHLLGPMILVMPSSNVPHHLEECLNSPFAADDTYLTADVPADIRRMFRATTVAAEWGLAGMSSGGYCTANLALRHPADYGAAGIMDGYFRPTDGPAAAALDDNPAAEDANDPLLAASRLARDAHPLPSFWIAAGSGDPADLAAARAFARALHGIEQVTLFEEPGVGHNFYAWVPAVPRLLAWLWTQVAPPALRVQFPIAGAVHHGVFAAPGGTKRHHAKLSRRCAPSRITAAASPSPTPTKRVTRRASRRRRLPSAAPG